MTTHIPSFNRRQFVLAVTATASAQALLSSKSVSARDFGPGAAPTRCPDPDVVAIDDEFKK
ncbi:MAG: SMP-30/gluconolactonase/LRE family protein, partial [Planctomycetaceae bacterium]|nr:SMP-30/gluconolactonase/LRE family protein [Planctomycetaceae bacterium]